MFLIVIKVSQAYSQEINITATLFSPILVPYFHENTCSIDRSVVFIIIRCDRIMTHLNIFEIYYAYYCSSSLIKNENYCNICHLRVSLNNTAAEYRTF